MSNLKFALFQFNPIVGDLDYNVKQLVDAIFVAKQNQADIFISSELAVSGYPPEDLLLRSDFQNKVMAKIDAFLSIDGITMLIGCPYIENSKCFNSVLVIRDGQILVRHDKLVLPNYSVFDEYRYFSIGNTPAVFECNSVKVGILLCEDMWSSRVASKLHQSGAEILCTVNASPFSIGKYNKRLEIARARILETGLPLIYVNQIGAQDELIFDGGSFVLDCEGHLVKQLPACQECLDYIEYNSKQFIMNQLEVSSYPDDTDAVYQGLVLAVKDYIGKNNIKGIVLGLSGGIDSALTLAIAVDALGKDRVMAVMMPSKFTADISIQDSKEMVDILGVRYEELAIGDIFNEFTQHLEPLFNNLPLDITEENLQARIRGTLLMAISNKLGYLVLTTGNKSEMATGYATLYGDMAGGFAVLKDVPKTLVYKLSRWRNTQSVVIPERIITRAPSAELHDNQTDQDSLPDYDTLDAIIELFVEQSLSKDEIIAKGYASDVVVKVIGLIKFNEYKRRQAAVGPKITSLGFTKDWRYPNTNHFTF